MRQTLDSVIGAEQHGGELSPADGGRRWRDPMPGSKESSSSCKEWRKSTVSSRRSSGRKESRNG